MAVVWYLELKLCRGPKPNKPPRMSMIDDATVSDIATRLRPAAQSNPDGNDQRSTFQRPPFMHHAPSSMSSCFSSADPPHSLANLSIESNTGQPL